MDAKAVGWAHAANSEEQLRTALADDAVSMIEADVMFRKRAETHAHHGHAVDPGSHDEVGVAVMAHPPTIPPDAIPFEAWLERVLAHNREGGTEPEKMSKRKGIKLDFKSPEAVGPCLKLLVDRRVMELVPDVWLNADILRGPGGPPSLFDARQFVELCQREVPTGVLSLGWTTGYPTNEGDLQGYTAAMVDEMLALCKQSVRKSTHITFPLHLWYAHRSWAQVERLLHDPSCADESNDELRQSFHTTITLWGEDNSTIRSWVEATSFYTHSRIYLDLVPPQPSTISKH